MPHPTSHAPASGFAEAMFHHPQFQFPEVPYAYTDVVLEGFESPQLVFENTGLLGECKALAELTPENRLALYSGNATAFTTGKGIASLYAGHQFGYFNPQLGDGRAALVGVVAQVPVACFYPVAFQRLVNSYRQKQDTLELPAFTLFQGSVQAELQLKGSGQTPYSRMGDGKAVLRSSVREAVASEAMFALGVPTTRAMALVQDFNLPVYRETTEHAAMVMRVAPSFLRPGHLEYWGRHGYNERLIPYLNVLYNDYFGFPPPEGLSLEGRVRHVMLAFAILTGVLFAQWQAVGFCHGVLNTDNLSMLGLTLDYGPYGFMDEFDMGHVCNHSDDGGRYSYKNQPAVGLWNLNRLLEALQPLWTDMQAYKALETEVETCYQDAFNTSFLTLYRQKLGLNDRMAHPDIPLGETLKQLFKALHASRVDYTRFFYGLAPYVKALKHQPDRVKLHEAHPCFAQFTSDSGHTALNHWLETCYVPLVLNGAAYYPPDEAPPNPVLVPRNYIAQALIECATQQNHQAFTSAMQPLLAPYDVQNMNHVWAGVPPAFAASICVSCSS